MIFSYTISNSNSCTYLDEVLIAKTLQIIVREKRDKDSNVCPKKGNQSLFYHHQDLAKSVSLHKLCSRKTPT